MDAAAWRRHKLLNSLQSVLLLISMAGLLSALGWIIAGPAGVVLLLGGGLLLVWLNPRVSSGLVLRMYRARRLDAWQAPTLHDMLTRLARRAELPARPALYYVPSGLINAFAVGTRRSAAIALTDSLLRTLNPRELNGVLAHEISHIRHNDMGVMGLADLFSRLTSLCALIGQFLLVLNLPLLMVSEQTISWTAILVLISAPTVSALMQLALSRSREFDADLGAAELSDDPKGLALALAKMERYQGRLFEQIFLPGRRVPEPSLLRTHPATEERIRRLLALQPSAYPLPYPWSDHLEPPLFHPVVPGRPRWHLHGIWY